jgi:hypothetical protein
MYKAVFQNSKVALVFAGVTLFSAVSMIGTSEDQGVLPEAAAQIQAQSSAIIADTQAFAASRSKGDAPPAEPSVFGEWSDESAQSDPAEGQQPVQDEEPPSAEIELDSDGVTVPRDPYIAERKLTIQPQ